MSHVDDGTLHALLDGALHAEDPERAAGVEAHLGRCADCRARLDAAAAVRDRAGQVLDLLDADPRPDFQEVLARAGHDRRGALARQARRTRGAAWAATIMLALGTGYLVRDRLVPDPRAAEPAARAVDTTAAEARAETPGSARARAADEPPLAPPPAQPDRQAPAREPDRAPATARAIESARPVDTPRPADPEIDVAPLIVTTAAGERRLDAPMPTAALRTGVTRATGVAGGAPGVVAPPGDLSIEEGRAWRLVTLDEALTLMDGTLYRLPNAEILEVAASGADAHARVRSRQRLPGDLDVVVTQERADVAEADRAAATGAAPAPEAGAYAPAPGDVVRVLRSRHWLTLQGSLPAHTIQALAAAAAPVPVP